MRPDLLPKIEEEEEKKEGDATQSPYQREGTERTEMVNISFEDELGIDSIFVPDFVGNKQYVDKKKQVTFNEK